MNKGSVSILRPRGEILNCYTNFFNFSFSNNSFNKKHKNTRFKSSLQAITMFILFYALKIILSGQVIIQCQCSVSPKMYVYR
jgi:hypothetical protein